MVRESLWQAVWRINRKIPVVLAVLILLNLCLYLYLSRVVEQQAAGLERSFITQQAEVRKAEQGGRLAESPLVIYARGLQDLKTFRQAIPGKGDLTGLIGELFDLAEHSGLVISRITYIPKQHEELALQQYSLDFVVAGSYDQIKKFTHRIEQSKRLISIDTMGLSRSQELNKVSLKLKLTTYFKAEES